MLPHGLKRFKLYPHEILKLKIKDVVFKTVNGKIYAEALLNGKTGSRNIPLINSIPYVKDWLTNIHKEQTLMGIYLWNGKKSGQENRHSSFVYNLQEL